MSRALLYTILGCALAPLNALADWDYPIAAQLAMYDAVETRCGSVDQATLRKKYADMLMRFTPEERSGMSKDRQSAQYREVLTEASKELDKEITAAGKGGGTEVCKKIIQNM